MVSNPDAPRRLGVYSLGFLKQPGLRRALRDAGWQVVPGFSRCDSVGVWGRRPVAARGVRAAHLSGKPLLTIEDGFLRSVRPGPGAPVLSLLLDDIGVHYDRAAPSRLEELIAAGQGDVARAAAGIALLRRLRLSKYNAAPPMETPPEGHILVVDQTRGDASIAHGGAGPDSFARMLEAAKTEHPGADIIIKTHPETASGAKRGHFTAADAGGRVAFLADDANPWDLIDGARAVYAVTSQMGMEALIAGKRVRCFGTPFYAGWGATEDEAPPPARRFARRNVAEIFAAAYLEYPLYFDPWRGGLATFEEAVAALACLRDAWEANRQPSIVCGARLWKRAHVTRFLTGPAGPPRYDDTPDRAAQKAAKRGRLVVWASKADEAAERAAADAGAPLWRLEDGFLRSAGLGAALTPPLSLALDDEGIYYDPTRPSRMERLIENAPDDAPSLARAATLRARITALGLTKYNLSGAAPAIAPPTGVRVILVPGQVEDDASILKGAGEIRTNLALLEATRAAAPDAFVVYKPHPDVEAGLRPGVVADVDLARLADAVARDAPAAAMLAMADEVWTMTSLMGFEALLRGRKAVCFGAPFYAGWGLTEDRGAVPDRRTARPSLDQLVHAALIDYPMYRDPISGLPCAPEVVVDRFAAGETPAPPGLRLLSKLQGAAAGYAWLWRR